MSISRAKLILSYQIDIYDNDNKFEILGIINYIKK